MIDRYLDRGELFALYDGEELKRRLRRHCRKRNALRTENLATVETARNRGYASALIRHILDICRNRFSVIQAGTDDFPKTIGSMKNAVSRFHTALRIFSPIIIRN